MNITFTATCSSYLVLYPEKCERILYWIVGLCKLLMTWICYSPLSHISCNDFLVITHDNHKILEWDLGRGVKPALSSLSHIQDSLKYSFFLPDLAINCFILQKRSYMPHKKIETFLRVKSLSILFQLNLCDWAFWVYGKQINGSGC